MNDFARLHIGHSRTNGVIAAVAMALITACAHRPVITRPWPVPNFPDLRLAILIRPPAGEEYGPQLVAFRGRTVVHESRRLFDDDFVNPTFFEFGDRTLLLADHGSEDAYGILAWSIEHGRIRDLGELDVALPEDGDVFTRGAARYARVERRGDSYLVTIPAPFLVDPRLDTERRVEETTTFTLPAPP